MNKNNELLMEINEIKEKYEDLKDIDSPLKGINEIKQILKKNDKKI